MYIAVYYLYITRSHSYGYTDLTTINALTIPMTMTIAPLILISSMKSNSAPNSCVERTQQGQWPISPQAIDNKTVRERFFNAPTKIFFKILLVLIFAFTSCEDGLKFANQKNLHIDPIFGLFSRQYT